MEEEKTVTYPDNSMATIAPVPFGKEMRSHFLFGLDYISLNHASFGAYPRFIRNIYHELHARVEEAPDLFIRNTSPQLLVESRQAVSQLLNASLNEVVFVPNATTAINTVLRNLEFADGDVIVYFDSIYDACEKTIDHVCEMNNGKVAKRVVNAVYPIEDNDLVDLFRTAIRDEKEKGKRPVLAIFDTIACFPAVRMPFEHLVAVAKEGGVLSLIDGAHGVGQIHIDLARLQPDFFVSNLHKWLYTPRGCAILYVPFRNQHLVRSTIPTSHGFIKRSQEVQDVTYEPVSDGSVFAKNFETVGTVDLSPYLCARDAIRWRKEACKGENAIIEYCTALAKNAGIKVANILGTEVLDNKTGTLTDCFMANVRLPLSVSPHPIEGQNTVRAEEIGIARQWILKRMTSDANTYVIIAPYGGIWWLRLSSQIYLTIDDFERAAIILKKLCDRMGNREFLHS